MFEGLNGIVRGFRLLVGALGLVTMAVGLMNQSTVVALNTIGVVGLAGLVIGGGTYFSSDGGDQLSRARTTLIAMVITTAISTLLFVFGRPFDENEKQFGLLSFVGAAALAFYAYVAAAGWHHFVQATAPQTKQCPDCAQQVLAAARKCQHCGYRFQAEGNH